MNDGLSGPEQSGTFPPESAGSDHGTHKSPPEPSMASQDPINLSTSREPDSETVGASQTRQRKGGIFGKFGHRNSDDDDWEDKKSLSGKATFTFASQVRATILNSWINVLLIAAPVGSMFRSYLPLYMYENLWRMLILSTVALYAVGANPIAVFVVNFIAIVYAYRTSGHSRTSYG